MWLKIKRAIKDFLSYCGIAFVGYLGCLAMLSYYIYIGVDSKYMGISLLYGIFASLYFIFVFLRIFLRVISENDQVGDRRK